MLPIMPQEKTVRCTHPDDMREFVMDGYLIHENGDVSDTQIEKEFCTACGCEIPQVKEDIIY